MIAKVKSGIPFQVTQNQKSLHFNLHEIPCPNCNSVETILLGFKQNEVCPKCLEGKIDSIL